MIKSIVSLAILAVFGLLMLALALLVVASVAITLVAVLHRRRPKLVPPPEDDRRLWTALRTSFLADPSFTVAVTLVLVLLALVSGWFIVPALALSVLTILDALVVVTLDVLIPGAANVPWRYNLRNMIVRWKNTVVTGAAFTVVIGLLVVMLAFVTGMYRLTEGSARAGNVVILQDGAVDEAFSNLPPTADVYRLPQAVRKEILTTDKGVYLATKEVYVIVNQPIPNAPADGKQRRFIQMRGIEDPYIAATVHGIELQEGTWFSPEGARKIQTGQGSKKGKLPGDLESVVVVGVAATAAIPADRAIEVVIGAGIAKELATDRPGGPVKVGEILNIGPRQWIVVGIMSSASSTFASEVWARDYLIGPLFGRTNSYSSYVIATKDADAAARMAKEMKEFKEVALQALPEPEYYEKLNGTNKQFFYSIMVVALIMAVGGVLGVMNTMFAAISQRSKDIGVLRLLGFTRWQITVSFLLESLAIAFAGGLLGCALGYLCDGYTATSIVGSGQGGGKSVILKLVVDGQVLGAGILLTFIMGAVGGLVPALSAMRLRPLESLR
jgi:ABC-type antimicrobial peptide transport system permease subunit